MKLGEICEIIMGQSPKGDTYNNIGKGSPLLNGPTEFGPQHPNCTLWTTSPTKICQSGDLIFCVRGSTTGRMNWADQPYCLGRGVGAFRSKTTDQIDTNFIFYQLTMRLQSLLSLSNGSVFPNLSAKDFHNFDIDWPSNVDRRAIASVLSSLDDNIQNNRQMNETLEEMARAIFKSWFVDFDPVHAKAAGNPPAHMDNETAALFPSTFGDDGLPIGWTEKPLKAFALEIESGKRPKGGIDKSLKEGVPSIGAESLLKIGDFEYSKVKYVKPEFAETSSKGWVQNYDVAIYKDGANVGDPTRVSLFGNGFPFDKFMVNEHVFLVRNTLMGQPFLYSLFQSKLFAQQLHSMGTSKAAQPGLNQQEVLSCKFVAPSEKLFDVFNQTIFTILLRLN